MNAVVVDATGAAVQNPNKLIVRSDCLTGLTITDRSLAHALHDVAVLFRSRDGGTYPCDRFARWEERVTVVAVQLAELTVLEPTRSLQEFLTTLYRGIGWSDQRNISPYKR